MTTPTSLPDSRRGIYGIPLIGIIARDIRGDINTVFYALIIVVTAVVLAVKVWGLAALTLTALACVPLMFVFFIAISWPYPSGR